MGEWAGAVQIGKTLMRSLLFVCGENALRSPMAEAMVKTAYGDRVYVDSVGIRQGALDPLAVAAMEEIGIDISGHRPKLVDDMVATSFDVIVTLTPFRGVIRDYFTICES